VGEAGESYFFQVKATDHVNNTSAWVEAGPVTVSAVTKYYYHGDQRVAMRQGDVVYFIHSDHLGSTSLTTDQSGAPVAETRYLPYGEERWTNEAQPTDFTFTGQRAERGFALMDYNARYYDPGLGRFVSADRVVPEAGNPQTLNRYAYAGNSPVRYTDPSGHCTPEECPWALTQKLWDRYGPATGAARYRLAAAALAAIKADEAIARANAGGGDLGGLKAAINLDMSNYLLKEGIREYEPRSWTYALEAGATGGLLTAGALNSGADNSVPFSPSQQRDIIGDPGPTGVTYPKGRTVYRVWGSDPGNPDMPGSGPWGRSWSPQDPSTVPNYREAAGLPSGGESGAYNRGRFVSVGTVNNASEIRVRQALSLDGQAGGLPEYTVPNPREQIHLTGVYGVNPEY
jgi:RHS repeat-associated protein